LATIAPIDVATPAVAGSPEPVVITPPSRWGSLGLREVWEYRELLYFLVRRDILVRYRQSLLGVIWVVAQPLALATIFSIFFGRLANIPSEGVPYPLFAFVALVPWMFVSIGVTTAAQSLVGDANLLAKVYFPRLALPLAKLGALLVDMGIALVVTFVLMALYGVVPTWHVVALPFFLLVGVLVAFGAGTFFAAANVKYRDVVVAVPLLVQVWLFATPVVYPGTLVTGAWQYIYALNPMVTVVGGVRWALLDTTPPTWAGIAISSGVAIVGVFVALFYFRRTQHFFADLV
jgi:lipopolysaccharide transport system permease protein